MNSLLFNVIEFQMKEGWNFPYSSRESMIFLRVLVDRTVIKKDELGAHD